MLKIYLEDLETSYNHHNGEGKWENIKAILHCIMSVQEAVELQKNVYLERIFSPEILGRLPHSGHDRVRRTALGLIGM